MNWRQNKKEKHKLFRDWSFLLKSGASFSESIRLLHNTHPGFEKELESIEQEVMEGGDLPHAFENVFGRLESVYVSVGARSGDIWESFEKLADYYDRQKKAREMWIEAMSYPVMVLLLSVGIFIFLILFVVPIFEEVYRESGGELPGLTRAIIHISEWVQSYGLIGIPLVAWAVIWLYRLRKNDEIKIKWISIAIRIPIMGRLFLLNEKRRFFYLFGFLNQRKEELIHTLMVSSSGISSIHLKNGVDQIIRELKEGNSLHEAMANTNYFTSSEALMIKIGEESGDLPSVVHRIVESLDQKIDIQRKVLQKMIEPLMLVIVGGIVGTILIAMYLPLFQMGQGME